MVVMVVLVVLLRGVLMELLLIGMVVLLLMEVVVVVLVVLLEGQVCDGVDVKRCTRLVEFLFLGRCCCCWGGGGGVQGVPKSLQHRGVVSRGEKLM